MDVLDELHVVSDLHFGGDRGHQIFTGTHLLQGFIEKLRALPAGRRVAFVINGDFIDFLAGPGATYFDGDGAADKLLAISNDPTFKPIFDELARFVATPDRLLVVVLGNHDLELALPRVQEALLERLGAREDPAPRGRVLLSVGGAGFAASVGQRKVLCVHGNEVDSFNLTDYERLRRAARDQVFGWQARPWIPNAGTQLVIDVMNGIKQRLPFVDLLKPEDDAVIPLLFALNQVSMNRLLDALEVAGRLSWDKTRKASGFLSLAEEVDAESSPGAGAVLIRPSAPQRRQRAAGELADILRNAFELPVEGENERLVKQLLDDAEEQFLTKQDPLALLGGDGEQRLGLGNLTTAALRATWSKFLGRDECERMRSALAHLATDRSFGLDVIDDQYERIDQLVPSDLPVVISGHTHLARKLRRPSGGLYLNTGTFARLMRLKRDVLGDPQKFKEFYRAVQQPQLEDLDGTDFVLHRPFVASVVESAAGVTAELFEIYQEGVNVDTRIVPVTSEAEGT